MLLSRHMVQHMTIATAAPTFLVLAAPVTLALGALLHRRDGSLWPREWIQEELRSFLAHLVTTPGGDGRDACGELGRLLLQRRVERSLTSHTRHVAMVDPFLVVGFRIAHCPVGIDPGSTRPMFRFECSCVS